MSEIDDVAATYAAAALAKDEAAFLAIFAPDVLVFDMWEQWVYQGRDAWAVSVRNWFRGLGDERVKVSFSPLFEKQDGDSAVYCATVRYAAVDAAGKELRSLQNRLSWTLQRTDGRWLVTHEHTSAPASFETMKVRLSQN